VSGVRPDDVRRAEASDVRASRVGARSRIYALAENVLVVPAMTRPRAVFPGQWIFVTRRCTQRQFLLRPDEETNNAFVYCLAEAAQRCEMKVLLSQMEANHHHTMLLDLHGRHVEFREHFHKMMAKSQNALRGRWENLWSSVEPCNVEVMTLEDVLDKLVYIATNPVKDGLVEKVHHWPGPNFVKALMTGKPMKAYRPKHFFRDDGPMPREVELVLGLPDDFEGKQAFLAELRRRITEVEEACARERQRTGRRVIGRRRILRQSWRDSPTSREPRRTLRPRIAARDKEVRIAALQRNKEWETEYRNAYRALRAGLAAEFPYGTYWLRRFANVRVKPPPVAD
jgi:putative transposase